MNVICVYIEVLAPKAIISVQYCVCWRQDTLNSPSQASSITLTPADSFEILLPPDSMSVLDMLTTVPPCY